MLRQASARPHDCPWKTKNKESSVYVGRILVPSPVWPGAGMEGASHVFYDVNSGLVWSMNMLLFLGHWQENFSLIRKNG